MPEYGQRIAKTDGPAYGQRIVDFAANVEGFTFTFPFDFSFGATGPTYGAPIYSDNGPQYGQAIVKPGPPLYGQERGVEA